MSKSSRDNQKITAKTGRPATGRNPLSGIRFAPSFKKSILEWAADQTDKPSFAESARRLIAYALNDHKLRKMFNTTENACRDLAQASEQK